MSTFRNPVGPQPSRVYWRRRLVVGLGLLAVIVVIVLIIVSPRSGTPSSEPTTSAKPSPAATDSSGTTSSGTTDAATCAPANVVVEARTDKTAYQAGELPLLSLTITNTGTKACTFSAGSDVQEYRMTSGTELYWTSKSCQSAPVAQLATLEPGVPIATTPFPWNRTRSDAANCAGERPPVTAGGASYHLGVIVNGIESKNASQFQLY